jgi:hypothetical protein
MELEMSEGRARRNRRVEPDDPARELAERQARELLAASAVELDGASCVRVKYLRNLAVARQLGSHAMAESDIGPHLLGWTTPEGEGGWRILNLYFSTNTTPALRETVMASVAKLVSADDMASGVQAEA